MWVFVRTAGSIDMVSDIKFKVIVEYWYGFDMTYLVDKKQTTRFNILSKTLSPKTIRPSIFPLLQVFVNTGQNICIYK